MAEIGDQFPIAYLITFTTYGTWLHGRDTGSVDREHNRYGDPLLPPDWEKERHERERLAEPPCVLDLPRRQVILKNLIEVTAHRPWLLIAAHVRTNHVHVVTRAPCPPEKVMDDYKAWGTRRLKEAGFDARRRKRWTERGSKRWLWRPENVQAAVRYVVEDQGDRMEVYLAPFDAELWFGDYLAVRAEKPEMAELDATEPDA